MEPAPEDGAGAQSAEWADRSLAELAYTVMDSETTGMSPSGGDEIIAIGAVRLGNGRALRQETFDRVGKPRRRASMNPGDDR